MLKSLNLKLPDKLINPDEHLKIDTPGVQAILLNGKFSTIELFEENDTSLAILMQILALCNNNQLIKTPGDNSKPFNPVDQALLRFAADKGFYKKLFEAIIPRRFEYYQTTQEFMCTVHELNGKFRAMVKGHPETVLNRSSKTLMHGLIQPLSYMLLNQMIFYSQWMAHKKLSVVAVAFKDYEWLPKFQEMEDESQNLIFVGLVGVKSQ